MGKVRTLGMRPARIYYNNNNPTNKMWENGTTVRGQRTYGTWSLLTSYTKLRILNGIIGLFWDRLWVQCWRLVCRLRKFQKIWRLFKFNCLVRLCWAEIRVLRNSNTAKLMSPKKHNAAGHTHIHNMYTHEKTRSANSAISYSTATGIILTNPTPLHRKLENYSATNYYTRL